MTLKKIPSELRNAVVELRLYFFQAIFFSVFSSLLVLAPTGYMLEVYDRVVNSRNYMTLGMLTGLVLAAFIVMQVLEWARIETMHAAGIALDRKLSSRLFDVVFEANLKKLPGGTVQPMNDLKVLRDFLRSIGFLAAMEAPVALTFLVLIFAISPVLGWAAVIGAFVQTLLAWLNERSTQPLLQEANRDALSTQNYVDNSLRNAQVIEAMGMLGAVCRLWSIQQQKFLKRQAQASDMAGGFQAVSKLWQNTVTSALLGIGCWLLLRDELAGGAGMMIIGSILGGRVLSPLVQMVTQWQSFINVRDAWARLDQLLAQLPVRSPSMSLPPPLGRLHVEPLLVSAPGSVLPILKGVSFVLEPGEALAVIGPSASGKTTLARLLMGLWPSVHGTVRLDGVDVHTWNKVELGPYVGYLPQGVELFDGTVAQNIARFGDVNSQKVEAAARAVGLHEFIVGLEQGYDSPVGRDGAALSGGQRQRVALARAIYGSPVFVVLDEPNSSLDEQGDAALAQVITHMKQRGTTFIIMTHRTSILGVSDKILVLRDGQMQALGPRDDVLAAISKVTTPPAIVHRVA